MNRKTFATVALVIILIVTGVGAYFFYSKKAPATPTPAGSAFPEEGMPVTGIPGAGGTGIETGGEVFVPGGAAPFPRVYELLYLPVAGAGFVETKDKSGIVQSSAVRYIERGLGYIFETPLATYTESRIVNETRSRISEALWGNGGKSVVVRSFDDTDNAIKTSILNISASSVLSTQGTSTASGGAFLNAEEFFLPDFIPFMAVAEDGTDKLFYLENGNAVSAGSLSTFNNTGVVRIFTSTFTEWLPQFPNQKLVTLTTKPSENVPGYLFFLDTKTKALTKVLSGINGLTSLTSHDGSSVLYAEIKSGTPELAVYDLTKKETRILAPQTLPEKCVWSAKNIIVYCAVPQTLPTAQYPDQWYQGLFSFSDNIWKIDTRTGIAEKILTPSDFRAPSLDMINLTLSSDDTHLLFVNKVTGIPWIFRINSLDVGASAPPETIATPTAPVNEGMEKIR
jgi:hypothetical protein